MDSRSRERSLEASLKDVAAYGQMVGFGETYFSAYAVWLGASSPLVGLLGTIPPFVGACLQPLAARLVDRTGRRKLFYMTGAALQGLTFLPIGASVLLPPSAAYPLLLGCVVLYFAGVHFATPAWNSVMGDLVPAEQRGRYFGLRGTVMVVSQWLATVVAGVGLEIFRRGGREATGFLMIFGSALAARLLSVFYLGRMKEPAYARPVRVEGFLSFLAGARRSNFGRFTLFVAAMNFSVAVSGPYFAVYMLRDLKFTYVEFMISHAILVVTQILALPRWGRVGDRAGNRLILAVTAFGVTLIPFVWLFAASPWIVWGAQALAGAIWSGFNLAAGNFLLDALPQEKRTAGVAHFNLTVGVGVLLGGLLGIAIVDRLPSRCTILGWTVALASHLQGVMLLSALLRAATLAIFLGRFREVRDVPNVGLAGALLRWSVARSITEAAGDFLTWYRREKNR